MWLNLLTDILIGASIGLLTNYLAIKMLFHPHEKKWFFPWIGLIPKEKKRIAEVIGRVVEKELIVAETFSEKLRHGSIGKGITGFITTKLKIIVEEQSSRNIEDILGEDLVNQIILITRNRVEEYIKSPNLIHRIDKELDHYLQSIFVKRPTELMSDKLIDGIRNVIISEINTFRTGKEIEPLVSAQIDKTIYNIINSKQRLSDFPWLVEKIEDNEKRVVEIILRYLVELLKTNRKLRKWIYNHIPQQLVNKFRNYKNEKWYKKVLGAFLSEEEIKERIRTAVDNEIERLDTVAGFENSRDNILSFYRKEIKPSLLSSTVGSLFSKIRIGNIDKIREWALKNIIYLLRKDNVGEYINNLLTHRINILLNQTVETLVTRVSPKEQLLLELKTGLREKILEILEENRIIILDKIELNIRNTISRLNVGDLAATSDKIDLSNISQKVFDYAIGFIADNMQNLMEGLKISEIVCEEINRFDLNRIENIIYRVSGKELRFITWFGGILGGFIGIIQFIKNQFM